MWKDINDERNFLMHEFFCVYPISRLGGNQEAANRLARIDSLLDIGRCMLKQVLEMTLAQFNIQPAEFRQFLAAVAERRKETEVRNARQVAVKRTLVGRIFEFYRSLRFYFG